MENGEDKVTTWPQLLAMVARNSILAVLFFAFGYGVFQLMMVQEEAEKELIGRTLDRCLPFQKEPSP